MEYKNQINRNSTDYLYHRRWANGSKHIRLEKTPAQRAMRRAKNREYYQRKKTETNRSPDEMAQNLKMETDNKGKYKKNIITYTLPNKYNGSNNGPIWCESRKTLGRKAVK